MFGLIRNILPKIHLIKNTQNFGKTILFYSEKLSNATRRVNNFEKKILVWTGKFKKVEDIPDYVAPEIVDKARNRMRIRIANIMMAATLLACVGMVYSGKKARSKGETVTQQNLEWHRNINEEAKPRT